MKYSEVAVVHKVPKNRLYRRSQQKDSLVLDLVAQEAGIQVLSSITAEIIAWAFDGADEVDNNLHMIKGRGAAMLNEKIIAKRAKNFTVIVTQDKLVSKLGTNFPIPVEVLPETIHLVRSGLKSLGAREINLRGAVNKYGPIITKHNNVILDSWFDDIPPELEGKIKNITGVIESGLFIKLRLTPCFLRFRGASLPVNNCSCCSSMASSRAFWK